MEKVPEFSLKDIGSRLKAIRLSKGMTLQAFYGPISTHVNNFSAVEHGNRSLGRKIALQLVKLYQINPIFLESGRGNMFLDPWPYDLPSDTMSMSEDVTGVPFFDVNPRELMRVQFNLERLEISYRVNFEPFNDCDAWLPVFGDSMAPEYGNGDLIVIKEIRLADLILWGEAYLIATKRDAGSITTIRLVFPHEDPDALTLRTLNPKYAGDAVLKKHQILKIYMIKGKLTRMQW